MFKSLFKRDEYTLVVIVLVLALIATFCAILYPRIYNDRLSAYWTVDVPYVQSSIVSGSDGSSHNIEAKFSVEVDRKVEGKVDQQKMYAVITDAVAKLDYDKVTGEDSVDYIKENIKASLGDYIGQDQVKGIYLTDLQSADSNPLNNYPRASRRDTIIRGLFQNIK